MQQRIAIFFKGIEKALRDNVPFVAYRKPGETKVFSLVQKTSRLHLFESFNQEGFVFAPFDKKGLKVWLPKDQCKSSVIDFTENYNVEKANEINDFWDGQSVDLLQSAHELLVQKGIESIQNNEADKIVLSRYENLKYSKLDTTQLFRKMLNTYRNGFVYWWFHPEIGMWMGATPESFINVVQGNFKTMALAGTQLFQGTTEANWSDKEIKEQQLVTDFIVENSKDCIQNLISEGPYTVKAGNLLHLRTDISGELIDAKSLKILVEKLHPTPAVCGLPKDIATKFIVQNEGYNRAYYAGYLGEINKDNKIDLYVNLRCMQLFDKELFIYVGGGITAESDPHKEWEETVFKAAIMKNVL